MADAEAVRFLDILTTASSVASYLGQLDVLPEHLLQAIAILDGRKRIEELGRPASPLLRRPGSSQGGASPAVRELVGRWYSNLGADPSASLEAGLLRRFEAEVGALGEAGTAGAMP